MLVHEGTVEEKMSRHRTESVLGVHYERVEAHTLTSSPDSSLGGGSDFLHPGLTAGEGNPFEMTHLEAMARNYKSCLDLSRNVAASIPGQTGKRGSRETQLSEVRRWLRGEPTADDLDLQAPPALRDRGSPSPSVD